LFTRSSGDFQLFNISHSGLLLSDKCPPEDISRLKDLYSEAQDFKEQGQWKRVLEILEEISAVDNEYKDSNNLESWAILKKQGYEKQQAMEHDSKFAELSRQEQRSKNILFGTFAIVIAIVFLLVVGRGIYQALSAMAGLFPGMNAMPTPSPVISTLKPSANQSGSPSSAEAIGGTQVFELAAGSCDAEVTILDADGNLFSSFKVSHGSPVTLELPPGDYIYKVQYSCANIAGASGVPGIEEPFTVLEKGENLNIVIPAQNGITKKVLGPLILIVILVLLLCIAVYKNAK
jgi:hypothetical protein